MKALAYRRWRAPKRLFTLLLPLVACNPEAELSDPPRPEVAPLQAPPVNPPRPAQLTLHLDPGRVLVVFEDGGFQIHDGHGTTLSEGRAVDELRATAPDVYTKYEALLPAPVRGPSAP